jgi:hypothetical protein
MSIQEQNFLKAIKFFDEADAGLQVGEFDIAYDTEYEKLNVLVTGLRSIIAMNPVNTDDDVIISKMKGRARFILRSIGA